ncbi:cilia- and flagella-associated protein 418 [Clinocottus analis]|uniref:cilia- and flagella-associated protein 418 n=1 Tax=Clinocottus analis TaxID=304258 RepID=UPI0035BF00CC
MDDDDDLDELLDEVERRFCRDVSVASPAGRSGKAPAGPVAVPVTGRVAGLVTRPVAAPVTRSVTHSATKLEQPMSSDVNAVDDVDDVDALLEELLQDDAASRHLKTQEFPEEKKLSSQSGGRKCCPVFVGGSSVPSGVGTATSKRSCDQLRCTSCDFRVLTFDDREWNSSCDYLFLRNNAPDRLKLGAQLRKRSGSRAFACQCSWFTATEPTDLRERAALRWVCGTHRD